MDAAALHLALTDPDGPITVSFDEFRAATAMLREVGYPIEQTDEEAWRPPARLA